MERFYPHRTSRVKRCENLVFAFCLIQASYWYSTNKKTKSLCANQSSMSTKPSKGTRFKVRQSYSEGESINVCASLGVCSLCSV